jgi:broad specificity phosphatase PhoE
MPKDSKDLLVRFTWPDPDLSAKSVRLTGDMTGWTAGFDMTRNEQLRCWQHEARLMCGTTVTWKFVVDGAWVYDSHVSFTADSYGNINNYFTVPYEAGNTNGVFDVSERCGVAPPAPPPSSSSSSSSSIKVPVSPSLGSIRAPSHPQLIIPHSSSPLKEKDSIEGSRELAAPRQIASPLWPLPASSLSTRTSASSMAPIAVNVNSPLETGSSNSMQSLSTIQIQSQIISNAQTISFPLSTGDTQQQQPPQPPQQLQQQQQRSNFHGYIGVGVAREFHEEFGIDVSRDKFRSGMGMRRSATASDMRSLEAEHYGLQKLALMGYKGGGGGHLYHRRTGTFDSKPLTTPLSSGPSTSREDEDGSSGSRSRFSISGSQKGDDQREADNEESEEMPGSSESDLNFGLSLEDDASQAAHTVGSHTSYTNIKPLHAVENGLGLTISLPHPKTSHDIVTDLCGTVNASNLISAQNNEGGGGGGHLGVPPLHAPAPQHPRGRGHSSTQIVVPESAEIASSVGIPLRIPISAKDISASLPTMQLSTAKDSGVGGTPGMYISTNYGSSGNILTPTASASSSTRASRGEGGGADSNSQSHWSLGAANSTSAMNSPSNSSQVAQQTALLTIQALLRREGKLILAMVGLPARGKTFMARRLKRHLSWMGYRIEIYNVGNYRRKYLGADQRHDFFDPSNAEGEEKRAQMAALAFEEMAEALKNDTIDIAIFDATNTTVHRRRWLVNEIHHRDLTYKLVFVESVCNDEQVIRANVRETKLKSPDYSNLPENVAVADFLRRIDHYKSVYEPLGELPEENELPYIKIIDVGRMIVANRIQVFLNSRVLFFLSNLHITPRPIWLTRHGESEFNVQGRIGGDSLLSPRGHAYALRLSAYMSQLYPQGTSELTVWTSTLKRTIMTAAPLGREIVSWKALDEIDAGICDSMSYEAIAASMPDEYSARAKNKFSYRYPRGESYQDIVHRLEPVSIELMRQRTPVLIISHQATLRVLYAYLTDRAPETCPDVLVPLHTVTQLTQKAYGAEEVRHELM